MSRFLLEEIQAIGLCIMNDETKGDQSIIFCIYSFSFEFWTKM